MKLKTKGESMAKSKLKYVIVRTYAAGVFSGYLVKKKVSASGQFEVTLKDARRLWYWKGASSLSQLAVDGVKCPLECKFPVAVPEIDLAQGIEIIPVSKIAQASIASVPVWKQT